jgi:hypothetical protein
MTIEIVAVITFVVAAVILWQAQQCSRPPDKEGALCD